MQNHKGYTLVEVLVALFVFAIATAMVGMALVENSQNRDILKQRSNRLLELQRAITLLQDDLIQASPKALLERGRPVGSFYATKSSFQFVRRGVINPGWTLPSSTLRKVTYQLNNQTLIRSLGPLNQEVKGAPVLSGVNRIEWLFYDSNGGKHDIWPPVQNLQYTLPNLVTLTIELEDLGVIEKTVSLPTGDLYGESL